MSAFSHPDAAGSAQNTADSPAAPQHHDLFLQPHYTVELSPLEDEDDLPMPASSGR